MATIASSGTTAEGSVEFGNWWMGKPDGSDATFLKDVIGFAVSESENLAWFEPIGRTRAVPVFTELMGVKIDMVVKFFNDADYNAFRKLRTSQAKVLVLKSPFGERWFVRFDEVFSVRIQRGAGPHREVTCGFTEVLEG